VLIRKYNIIKIIYKTDEAKVLPIKELKESGEW